VVNLFFLGALALRREPEPAKCILPYTTEDTNRSVEFVYRNAFDKLVAMETSHIVRSRPTHAVLAHGLSSADGAGPISSALFATAAGHLLSPVGGLSIHELKYPDYCGKTGRTCRDPGLLGAIEHARTVHDTLFEGCGWFMQAQMFMRANAHVQKRFSFRPPKDASRTVRMTRFPQRMTEEDESEMVQNIIFAYDRIRESYESAQASVPMRAESKASASLAALLRIT
jgi:hypothetical protein